MIRSGLEVVGRDFYGVFPLRGKLLNVREATHKQIMENQEIQKYVVRPLSCFVLFLRMIESLGLIIATSCAMRPARPYTDNVHLFFSFAASSRSWVCSSARSTRTSRACATAPS